MNDRQTKKQRMTENEAVFRRYNEKVEKDLRTMQEMAEADGFPVSHDHDHLSFHFYCECSDENCIERIPMRLPVYKDIHARRDTFIAIPGHEELLVEDVIGREETYVTVRKHKTPSENPDSLQKTSNNRQ